MAKRTIVVAAGNLMLEDGELVELMTAIFAWKGYLGVSKPDSGEYKNICSVYSKYEASIQEAVDNSIDPSKSQEPFKN